MIRSFTYLPVCGRSRDGSWGCKMKAWRQFRKLERVWVNAVVSGGRGWGERTDRQTDIFICFKLQNCLARKPLLPVRSSHTALWLRLVFGMWVSGSFSCFRWKHTYCRLPFLLWRLLPLFLLDFDVLLCRMYLLSCSRTRQLSWRDASPVLQRCLLGDTVKGTPLTYNTQVLRLSFPSVLAVF